MLQCIIGVGPISWCFKAKELSLERYCSRPRVSLNLYMYFTQTYNTPLRGVLRETWLLYVGITYVATDVVTLRRNNIGNDRRGYFT